MKKVFVKICSMVAIFSLIMAVNSFAAVGDKVDNVFLNKAESDITGSYFELDDYQTFEEMASKKGWGDNLLSAKYAVDGTTEEWNDFSRVAFKSSKSALELDLGGYYELNICDIYHAWLPAMGNTTGSDETSVLVSSDGGKTWNTVIDKKPLDKEDMVRELDSDGTAIYMSTFDLGGVVANKVRFIFRDTDTGSDITFSIEETNY